MACFLVIAVKHCTRQIDRTTPLGGKMNDKSRELGLLPHKTSTSAPRKSASFVVPAKEIKNQDTTCSAGFILKGWKKQSIKTFQKTNI